jgi:hypothetical protein
MKKGAFIVLCFLLLNTQVFSQNYTISGYVEDAQSKERLIGVSVYDLSSNTGSYTNNFGFYSISFPANKKINLKIAYPGYEDKIVEIFLTSNLSKNILLSFNNSIEEVEVSTNMHDRIENKPETGVHQIKIQEIKLLPSLTGEKDIMRAYQLMPGVQSGSEGSTGIYVRGGSPDQNLILLDDIPLYYVYHLGGFYSVFDPEIIKSSKLYKGGFPARYGGRISSVFDIRMNDGNKHRFNKTISLGVLASKFLIEGPVKKDTSSFIFSIRRSNLDIFTRLWAKMNSNNSIWWYSFYDIYAKFNHKFSDKDQIYLSFYMGKDNILFKDTYYGNNYEYNDNSKINWGNILASLRWNHKYNAKLYSNLTFAHTRFRYNTQFESTNIDIAGNSVYAQNIYTFLSDVNDYIFKIDYDYYPNNKNKLKLGISSVFHTFKPNLTKTLDTYETQVLSDTTIKANIIYAVENSAYLEDQININNTVSMNAGLHFSSYHLQSNSYYCLQPRFVSNFKLKRSSSLKFSYSKMVQYVHLLSKTGGGLPADLWVPSTERIKPLHSNLYSFAFVKSIDKLHLEISAETFYKDMSNLIDYKEGAILFGGSNNWEEKIETGGKGKSYGAEFLIKKNTGKTSGWISYYISRTLRQFNSINNGEPYLFKYDRTHDISIVYNYKIKENIQFSATWVYSSGNLITLAASKYDLLNFDYRGWTDDTYIFDEAHIYNGRNTFRLPPYHRFDVGFNFIKQKTKGLRTWSIGIYNVYNRKNPYYVYLKPENNTYRLYQFSLFPIIPSFNYSFEFK